MRTIVQYITSFASTVSLAATLSTLVIVDMIGVVPVLPINLMLFSSDNGQMVFSSDGGYVCQV